MDPWLSYTVTAFLAFLAGALTLRGRWLNQNIQDEEARLKLKAKTEAEEHHITQKYVDMTRSEYLQILKRHDEDIAHKTIEYEKTVVIQDEKIAKLQSIHMDCLRDNLSLERKLTEQELKNKDSEGKIALLEQEVAHMKETITALFTNPEDVKWAVELIKSRRSSSS